MALFKADALQTLGVAHRFIKISTAQSIANISALNAAHLYLDRIHRSLAIQNIGGKPAQCCHLISPTLYLVAHSGLGFHGITQRAHHRHRLYACPCIDEFLVVRLWPHFRQRLHLNLVIRNCAQVILEARPNIFAGATNFFTNVIDALHWSGRGLLLGYRRALRLLDCLSRIGRIIRFNSILFCL